MLVEERLEGNSRTSSKVTMLPTKALIVEDEKPIATLLRVLLEREGIDCDTAVNGADALAKLHRSKPDVMLLDLIMPVMSGEELLKAIHAEPDLKDIPVVVVSTSDTIAGFEHCGYPLLHKPFNPADVTRAVAEVLAGADAPGEAPAA